MKQTPIQEIRPAVTAAIFNKEGHILLQKRKDVGSWGLISGHVEFGETITEALLREIREETSTHAEILRFIGLYSAPPYQVYDYGEKTVQYVTSYFEVRLHADIPEDYSRDETEELRFFPIDGLPANLAQVNPNWLSDALNKREGPFIR